MFNKNSLANKEVANPIKMEVFEENFNSEDEDEDIEYSDDFSFESASEESEDEEERDLAWGAIIHSIENEQDFPVQLALDDEQAEIEKDSGIRSVSGQDMGDPGKCQGIGKRGI